MLYELYPLQLIYEGLDERVQGLRSTSSVFCKTTCAELANGINQRNLSR